MTEPRFLFHASAMAIGGHIGRPYHEVLETQASSVLPIVGGKASATAENFKYYGMISFARASSTVHGNIEEGGENGRVFNTLSTVAVEGLNIADLITADRVVARLTSERGEKDPELPMVTLGSYFENLRVLGQRVNLKLHEEWSEVSNGRKLLALDDEGPRRNRTFSDRKALVSIFSPEKVPAGMDVKILDEDLRTSQLQAKAPWRIHIPGFGSVYFGELMITRYAWRLSMIRLEMGSPCEGTVVIASTEGNGSTYP